MSCWIIDALHRKALPTSSLAIGEYGPIIALQDPLDKGKPDVIVDLLCGGVLAVHSVKSETFRRIIGYTWVDDGTDIIRVVYMNNFLKKYTVSKLLY